MRILLTSSRAPVTLELIRALAAVGHEVFATDTFAPTLGSHSRWLCRHFLTPPPRQAPEAFAAALCKIVTTQRIDWLIPTCEEVFHVGRCHAPLAAVTNVLAAPLAELDRWHNKFTFQQHARARGLLTPRTELVQSRTELAAALDRFPRYFLKPAYSRFAARVLTNCGPGAAPNPLTACRPSPAEPWLVQEFIDGVSECCYSVVHQGRITVHCSYRTPHRFNGGSGTSFLSIDGDPLFKTAGRLLEGTGFTGQFALDVLRTADGRRYLLECNPRATSGVHLLQPAALVRGLLDARAPTWIEPPGTYRQLLLLVLAEGPRRLWGAPPRRWFGDVILDGRDPLPALTQLVQLGHFAAVSRRRRLSLVAATTADIEWNGPGAP